ncbi:MAG TPA: hypothetical protein VI583_01690 [Cyclobacteriaceae bacterium]|nr:hypothetical protein [Cyclobacteriaceae bacterium]
MNASKIFKSIALAGILLLSQCESADDPQTSDQLSDFAAKYITMRFGSQNSLQESRNSAVNNSFQDLFGLHLSNIAGRLAEGSPDGSITESDTVVIEDPGYKDSTGTGVDGDTVIYEDPWISCAEITETVNEDGSITVIYDYGDGCEEGWDSYKYLIYGRIASTYFSSNARVGSKFIDEYSYETVYDNYGTRYYYDSSVWEMDGISQYAGQSIYDTTDYAFSGWYTYFDNTTYRYNDEEYQYSSNCKMTYDVNGSVTEYADYEYYVGDDFYKSTVLEPLIMDYTCWQNSALEASNSADAASGIACIILYTAGVEKVVFKQGDESGEIIIDYGDGECDNIITITENGVTVNIDLSEQWGVLAGTENK